MNYFGDEFDVYGFRYTINRIASALITGIWGKGGQMQKWPSSSKSAPAYVRVSWSGMFQGTANYNGVSAKDFPTMAILACPPHISPDIISNQNRNRDDLNIVQKCIQRSISKTYLTSATAFKDFALSYTTPTHSCPIPVDSNSDHMIAHSIPVPSFQAPIYSNSMLTRANSAPARAFIALLCTYISIYNPYVIITRKNANKLKSKIYQFDKEPKNVSISYSISLFLEYTLIVLNSFKDKLKALNLLSEFNYSDITIQEGLITHTITQEMETEQIGIMQE